MPVITDHNDGAHHLKVLAEIISLNCLHEIKSLGNAQAVLLNMSQWVTTVTNTSDNLGELAKNRQVDQQHPVDRDSDGSTAITASQERAVRAKTKTWKRRIAKACNACRTRKLRCDGSRPTCSRCETNGIDCFYADYRNQTSVQNSRPGSTYVQQLEQRLHEAESLLNKPPSHVAADAGGANDERQPSDYASISSSSPTSRSSVAQQGGTGQGSLLVRGRTGELRYFGPSSSVSILSPNGLNWIASQTADSSVRRTLKTPFDDGREWTEWTHPLIQETLSKRAQWPLPPSTDAFTLINDYFQHEHKGLPIFHPPTFISLLGQQYSQDAVTSPGWWASLNAILAIAQRRKDEQNDTSDKDASWRFAQNSLDVVMDLSMRNTSIASVQALLALCSYFVGTPNPQPGFFLVGVAIRTADAIGLHETVSHPNISAFERQQRHQVFWAAAILDQSTSFRTGRPPAQSLYKIKIELPHSPPEGNLEIRFEDGKTEQIDVFRLSAWLARIQANIHHELYSPSSPEGFDEYLSDITRGQDQQLRNWSLELPENARPGCPLQTWTPPVRLELIRLHLDYHNCVISIHRPSGYRHPTGRRNSKPRQIASPSETSFEKCIESAKAITELLWMIPSRAESFIWTATHFPISAFVVLFIQVLREPASDDVDAIMNDAQSLVQFLLRVAEKNAQSHAKPGVAIMTELYKVALAAINRAATGTASVSSSETSKNGTNVSQPAAEAAFNPLRQLTVVDRSGIDEQHNARSSFEYAQQPQNITGGDRMDIGPGSLIDFGSGEAMNLMYPTGSAWETLTQSMPLPFPWDWNNLPVDIDTFEAVQFASQ